MFDREILTLCMCILCVNTLTQMRCDTTRIMLSSLRMHTNRSFCLFLAPYADEMPAKGPGCLGPFKSHGFELSESGKLKFASSWVIEARRDLSGTVRVEMMKDQRISAKTPPEMSSLTKVQTPTNH